MTKLETYKKIKTAIKRQFMKNGVIRIILLFVLLKMFNVICGDLSFADSIKSSPNYLVILIHGVGTNYNSTFVEKYGNLEKYLKQNLNLDGYVYGYNFLDSKGSNYDHAKELADLSIANNWFEKAREGFKSWYAKEVLKKPNAVDLVPENVIPHKYILIAHSEGGLAARAYVTSDYYNNDVAALIKSLERKT